MSGVTGIKNCGSMYLPNLCGMRTVFSVVIIAQLFAFVLALGPVGSFSQDRWANLGLMSMFIQWITLFSCSVLCMIRPYLCRFGTVGVTIASFGTLLGITALFSELTYWLYYQTIWHYDTAWHLDFLIRNIGIATIVSTLVLRYFYIQQQWKHNLEAEAESRMQALQARIRPHFLFNSMNTIASLTRTNPEQAETAVENLADLFRASIGDERKLTTIEEEVQLCQRYLDIEKLRLGNRLQVNMNIADLPNTARIPPLTLQPLVENAIYHGIETSTEGGSIDIEAIHSKNKVVITITNPIGKDESSTHRQGNRIALDNIRERLAVYFGLEENLSTEIRDHSYRVTITLPDNYEKR